MILWSLQPEDVWSLLQTTGIFRTDPLGWPEDQRCCPWFTAAYAWMLGQMERRIGPRPAEVTYPIWAWHTAQPNKSKPDLRGSGYLPRGTRGVRMEIEVPDRHVLLSDFELWHCVLNDCFLALTAKEDAEEEQAELEARHSGDYEGLQQRKEQSWERIFDLRLHGRYLGYASASSPRSIQATFWELRLEQVRRVTHFTAR